MLPLLCVVLHLIFFIGITLVRRPSPLTTSPDDIIFHKAQANSQHSALTDVTNSPVTFTSKGIQGAAISQVAMVVGCHGTKHIKCSPSPLPHHLVNRDQRRHRDVIKSWNNTATKSTHCHSPCTMSKSYFLLFNLRSLWYLERYMYHVVIGGIVLGKIQKTMMFPIPFLSFCFHGVSSQAHCVNTKSTSICMHISYLPHNVQGNRLTPPATSHTSQQFATLPQDSSSSEWHPSNISSLEGLQLLHHQHLRTREKNYANRMFCIQELC